MTCKLHKLNSKKLFCQIIFIILPSLVLQTIQHIHHYSHIIRVIYVMTPWQGTCNNKVTVLSHKGLLFRIIWDSSGGLSRHFCPCSPEDTSLFWSCDFSSSAASKLTFSSTFSCLVLYSNPVSVTCYYNPTRTICWYCKVKSKYSSF